VACPSPSDNLHHAINPQAHLGTKNCTASMERYVYRRRSDGIFVFNLAKTWEKLQLAARIIVAIENPQDIVAISARPYGQRAVLKFANHTGSRSTVGRHTPGALLLLLLQVCLLCCCCYTVLAVAAGAAPACCTVTGASAKPRDGYHRGGWCGAPGGRQWMDEAHWMGALEHSACAMDAALMQQQQQQQQPPRQQSQQQQQQ
jgi:hypothetical protein